ncbi:MAG: ABC transporter ATP-binding protein [Steroidobacteraceae bacterium]|nr:ABC transporter ATP-binding protein [Steroidobacteraceae bacterium]
MAESAPDTNGLAVEARDLTRRFGSVLAVDHVSLDIERAHIYGFLGPNGSGKSTTIRMFCGLLRPTSGTVRVLGRDITREPEAVRSKVGYMTQKFSLWDDLTVLENLRFIASIYTLGKRKAQQRIDAVLEEFKLRPLAGRLAAQMSGGQRQRLALAAATLHEPEMLMLDEPTSAVDPQSRRDFWESLFALVARGTTILVSTHYMDEAERCHRLAILDQGRVVAEGEPERLMDELPLQVIEVQAKDVDGARRELHTLPEVRSLAQLGLRLHVLIDQDVPDAAGRVRDTLARAGIAAEVEATRANLEDVFVAATLPGRQSGERSDA